MPLVISNATTTESVTLYVDLSRNITVSDNSYSRESIVTDPLNINVFDNGRTTEVITRRLDSLISIVDKYQVQDIVNTLGLISAPIDKSFISEFISLNLTNIPDIEIKIEDQIFVSEFLFNAYKIFVYDDSYSRESVTLADFRISII
jgi:hypothetical protein